MLSARDSDLAVTRQTTVPVLLEIRVLRMEMDSEKGIMQIIHNSSCDRCDEKNARCYECQGRIWYDVGRKIKEDFLKEMVFKLRPEG